MAYGDEDFLLVFGREGSPPDLSGITGAFDRLADDIDAALDSFVVEAGLFFQREAKLRPPEGGKMPYLTGTLQLSTQLDPTVRKATEAEGDVRYVVVSSGVEYAPYQELGFIHHRSGKRVQGKGFFAHGQRKTEEMIAGLLPRRLQDVVDRHHRVVQM